MSRIATISFKRPAKQLLEALKQNSVSLVTLSKDFQPLLANVNVVSFYERQQTPLLKSLVSLYMSMSNTAQDNIDVR